jgi:hypothetical protein
MHGVMDKVASWLVLPGGPGPLSADPGHVYQVYPCIQCRV